MIESRNRRSLTLPTRSDHSCRSALTEAGQADSQAAFRKHAGRTGGVGTNQ